MNSILNQIVAKIFKKKKETLQIKPVRQIICLDITIFLLFFQGAGGGIKVVIGILVIYYP